MPRPPLPASEMAAADSTGARVVVTIRTTAATLDALDAIARAEDRPRASVMRAAVETWLASGAPERTVPRGDRRVLVRLPRETVERLDAVRSGTREGAVLSAITARIGGETRRSRKSTRTTG